MSAFTQARTAILATGVIFLAGCASTTIFPGDNGNFSLHTTSSEQSYAEKDAMKKATEHCAKLGKSLVVVDHKTDYHGVDKSTQATIGLVGAVVGVGNPAKGSADYQVTMKFTCR